MPPQRDGPARWRSSTTDLRARDRPPADRRRAATGSAGCPGRCPSICPGCTGFRRRSAHRLATKHWPVIGSDRCPIGQALAGAATTTGAATNSAPHAAANSALEIPTRTAMCVSLLRDRSAGDHDWLAESGPHAGGVERPQRFPCGAHTAGRDELVVEVEELAACSDHGSCSLGTHQVRPALRVWAPQREVSQVSNGVGSTVSPTRTVTRLRSPRCGQRRTLS